MYPTSQFAGISDWCLGGIPNCFIVGAVTKATIKIKDFKIDPFGYIASKLQEANESLVKNVFPAMNKALHPDFTMPWFLTAYKYAFGIAVVLWAFILIYEFVQVARKAIPSDQLVDDLVEFTPKFFIGAMVGPFVGNFLMTLFGALNDAIIGWGGEGGIKGATDRLSTLVTGVDSNIVVGNVIVTIFIFVLMVIGMVLIFIAMLFMYVILYGAGAIFPIGWAWTVRSADREHGWRIIRIFAGVLAAQPITFFMLQVFLSMTEANVFGIGVGEKDGLQQTIALFGSALAMLMVGVVPYGLNKLAPVGPSATPGAGVGLRGWSGAGKSSGGGSSASDSRLGQVARHQSSGTGTGSAAETGGGLATKTAASSSGSGTAAAGGPAGVALAAGLALKKAADKLGSKAEGAADEAGEKGDSGGGDSSRSSDAAAGGSGDGDPAGPGSSGVGGRTSPGPQRGDDGSPRPDGTDSGSQGSGSTAKPGDPAGGSGGRDAAGKSSSGSGGSAGDAGGGAGRSSTAAAVDAGSGPRSSSASGGGSQVGRSPRGAGGGSRGGSLLAAVSDGVKTANNKVGQTVEGAARVGQVIDSQAAQQAAHQYRRHD